MIPQIFKIVITGGPCAGKSVALEWIKKEFSKMGYTTLFISETATELITSGIAPWTCGTADDYQICQLKLQLEKEKVFEDAAKTMPSEKILIVCDRGALDNKAYMDNDTFTSYIEKIGLNEVDLRDNYDAVFHLTTTAKGAEDSYTLENNAARTETLDEAIALDDKLIAAWTGHPHFRVIDNSSNFEGKMRRLIAEISMFLGEPEPLEIERKFLIKYPDINWLENNPYCQRIEIVQTYLKSTADEEIRVRQRGLNGNQIYFKTIKKKISDIKRVEIEERISKEEYLSIVENDELAGYQIVKTRYCLTYKNQYFEIDLYPFWEDKAIVEIELIDENLNVVFPSQITVIKEVTNDVSYKNSTLAKRFGVL